MNFLHFHDATFCACFSYIERPGDTKITAKCNNKSIMRKLHAKVETQKMPVRLVIQNHPCWDSFIYCRFICKCLQKFCNSSLLSCTFVAPAKQLTRIFCLHFFTVKSLRRFPAQREKWFQFRRFFSAKTIRRASDKKLLRNLISACLRTAELTRKDIREYVRWFELRLQTSGWPFWTFVPTLFL